MIKIGYFFLKNNKGRNINLSGEKKGLCTVYEQYHGQLDRAGKILERLVTTFLSGEYEKNILDGYSLKLVQIGQAARCTSTTVSAEDIPLGLDLTGKSEKGMFMVSARMVSKFTTSILSGLYKIENQTSNISHSNR